MHIGFDAKRLFLNFTGLGNYSRRLVSQYHEAYPEDTISLLTPKIKADPRTQPFVTDTRYSVIQPHGFKPLWRMMDMVGDIRAAKLDVYHGLSHELPIGLSKLNIGKVVTIHDLIFKYYPQDYTFMDRQIYDLKWKHACKTADVIIAISEQTKADIIEFYQVRPEKIKVLYQGADDIFAVPVDREGVQLAQKKYALPEVYNLYVGSVISRKNLVAIVKAMALQKKSDQIPLVIIGQGNNYTKEVLKAATAEGVSQLLIWLGSPSFADFPAIYKGAGMMIYPSFYEGFGLPVIEAMQVGIPVITSNQSSLKEAGGKAALLIDPHDPEEIATAMTRIQGDPSLCREMVLKGFEHLATLSVNSGMDQYHSLYQSLKP